MRYYLKKIRKEKGLTQSEIAKRVGIARTTYTNIELGTKNPSLNIAIKLKKTLNTDDDNIFLNYDVPNCNIADQESESA
jgi:putative transcriptional regulator